MPLKMILLLLALPLLGSAQNSRLADRPPMGWNSWNCFRNEINEKQIHAIADAMVANGMRDAGYQYLIIDDGWMTKERDSTGHIIPDKKKFPSGMKALADYIHSCGLKFGLYSAPGCYTCQKLMGSLGHEQTDADDYAAWGVDYLKYDWCNYPSVEVVALKTPVPECRAAFEKMAQCLKNTGREIFYSVNDECEKGTNDGALPWVKGVANMHRTSDDIKNNWERMLYCLESTAELWPYAGKGYWNDPDMLEVGNEKKESLWGKISPVTMNLTEYKSHFAMWCMVAAPLMAGNDLRNMSAEIREILTCRPLIAIDQDPLGKQGKRIRREGLRELWIKELSGNRLAIALFNKGSDPADMTLTRSELPVKGRYHLTDALTGREIGRLKKENVLKGIAPHEARILLLMPIGKISKP
ncbi:MAG: alpha-galactosidase [Marinilabiliales bacterium]|nr:alpha-galactosidase [Marinilabiliales bacterium]